jgi:hypothetical protein
MSTAPSSPPPKKKFCVDFPNNRPFSIPLPFGGELRSIVDPSHGPPTDCTLAHSLMLQIMPMMAGLACFLKVLKVIQVLEKAIQTKPIPIAPMVPDLLQAIGDLKGCFNLIDPTAILSMIKAILKLILAYIGCFIDGFESIRNFQVGIDLAATNGTPLVLGSLSCAKKNADTSLASLMDAMSGVQPLMDLIDLVAGVVGKDLGLPKLQLGGGGGQDPLQPIIDFRDALQEIVDKIPG